MRNKIEPIYIELTDRQLKQIRNEWKGELVELFQSGSYEYGILGYPLRITYGQLLFPVHIVGEVNGTKIRYGFDQSVNIISENIVPFKRLKRICL